MAEADVIDVQDLRKGYDGVEALRGLSLQVPAGSICGFLGRNGAGKTTTLKILLGMVHPTSGSARVFGLDAGGASREWRSGAASGSSARTKSSTATCRSTRSSGSRPGSSPAGDAISSSSTGRPSTSRRRSRSTPCRAACAPSWRCSSPSAAGPICSCSTSRTSGLDPASIEQVLQALVAQVADRGQTVFFSSHQIAELEQIADRIAIVDGGRTRDTSRAPSVTR